MHDFTTYSSNEPVVCPVCKTELTRRNPSDRIWIRCEECSTDHYFAPWRDIPTRSVPDSLKKSHKGCGCGRCGQ